MWCVSLCSFYSFFRYIITKQSKFAFHHSFIPSTWAIFLHSVTIFSSLLLPVCVCHQIVAPLLHLAPHTHKKSDMNHDVVYSFTFILFKFISCIHHRCWSTIQMNFDVSNFLSSSHRCWCFFAGFFLFDMKICLLSSYTNALLLIVVCSTASSSSSSSSAHKKKTLEESLLLVHIRSNSGVMYTFFVVAAFSFIYSLKGITWIVWKK